MQLNRIPYEANGDEPKEQMEASEEIDEGKGRGHALTNSTAQANLRKNLKRNHGYRHAERWRIRPEGERVLVVGGWRGEREESEGTRRERGVGEVPSIWGHRTRRHLLLLSCVFVPFSSLSPSATRRLGKGASGVGQFLYGLKSALRQPMGS